MLVEPLATLFELFLAMSHSAKALPLAVASVPQVQVVVLSYSAEAVMEVGPWAGMVMVFEQALVGLLPVPHSPAKC